MARREELVWKGCYSTEDAESLLIENQKEHRFNVLVLMPPRQWEVLGEEVSEDEISSPDAVRNLVLRLKDRLPDTPLLNILIRVSALVRDEARQTEWPAIKSRLLDAAGKVGLPIEEVPALEKGIDEFDGAFLYPSGKFLNLAKTIEQYGNTLKGFGLYILGSQKLPTSEFEQLCSALPSMEQLRFIGVDDSRLTDAICELVSRCATTLRGLSIRRMGKLSRHSMEALGKVLASPTCRLEKLHLSFRQYECLMLQGAHSLRDLSLNFEGEEVSEDVPSVTAFSELTSLERLCIDGTVDKILKGVCEALEEGQLLQLHTLRLDRLESEEGMASLAAALQSPGCSLRELTISNIGTEMDSLMRALPSSKIEALYLSKAEKDPNKAYIALAQALHDPTCKLTVPLDLEETGSKNQQ